MSSLWKAETVTPPAPAPSVAFAPTVASTTPSLTKITAETPMPALEPIAMLPAYSS